MSVFEPNDRFARKSAALGRAYEISNKDKEDKLAEAGKAKSKTGPCETCKKEAELHRFRVSTTDRSEGSASFHIDMKWLCVECEPKPKKHKGEEKTQAQLKSILKTARRAMR